jgi:hypothetical protein
MAENPRETVICAALAHVGGCRFHFLEIHAMLAV